MHRKTRQLTALVIASCCVIAGVIWGQDPPTNPVANENATPTTLVSEIDGQPTLEELKEAGAQRSSYRREQNLPATGEAPKPQLETFQQTIRPILANACFDCHGPDIQEGNIQVDTLDPDLAHGEDVAWWLEVFAVLSNGEMPPADDVELSDEDRAKIIDWLSTELQTASRIRRDSKGETSFRRMTRYEYNYALQDLLRLPYNFAKDLPPEAVEEGGFENNAETLHMSISQFSTYRELARKALDRATVRGDRPEPIYWGVSMKEAAASEWAQQESEIAKVREKHQDDPEKTEREVQRVLKKFQNRHSRTYFQNQTTHRTALVNWRYPGAKYAWKPVDARPPVPEMSDTVAILPPRQRLIVELGDRIPERGILRVRARAASLRTEGQQVPSLQLEFGWQASNDSHASVRISSADTPIEATPEHPEFYQWDVPISEIYPRNLVRNVNKLGDLPSPSEYVKFINSSVSRGDIQIDYVEVIAPVYEAWPPDSHTRLFGSTVALADETASAKRILGEFMPRAWRRPIRDSELDRKLVLFQTIRNQCDDFETAITEVLATVLSSPQFLYLAQPTAPSEGNTSNQFALATRLAMFLWCSLPDQRLRELARDQRLNDPATLAAEVDRMLADDRSMRFSEHFVYQWLGMQLLDYLKVDRKVYPGFDPTLKEAMQQEPVVFFHEVLRQNHSVLDFLHADYVLVNERLAQHYGIQNVYGNHFRRVTLPPEYERGGLLTLPGLLAMNSDGKDSHPLKRSIWILENLLNDPPPPPPPAVPQIDLADPEIAKLTLKERMADHRNQAACRSCHMKIDPWGIALENFDAIGGWRTHVNKQLVDASSTLFNQQELSGVDGLKRFLLEQRQDQFSRALVEKLTMYAIGRPTTFADRAELERITADVRKQDDGLKTMIKQIVLSSLFRE
ncbi:MAG: DUF1592 domain-containing protein [Planctomycetota bacterium]